MECRTLYENIAHDMTVRTSTGVCLEQAINATTNHSYLPSYIGVGTNLGLHAAQVYGA